MSGKLHGYTTKLLYYWDKVYGWIHISEKKKLKEAYERFKANPKRRIYIPKGE